MPPTYTFESLRDQLLHENAQFDATTLRHVPFADLPRAGIGDAGAAACPFDLIWEERDRRINEMAVQIARNEADPDGPKLVPDPALYAAALSYLHTRPVPAPPWDLLSPVTHAYLLLRCLRAHLDAPEARLKQLEGALHTIQDTATDARVQGYALLMRKVMENVRHSEPEPEEIPMFRRLTFDFFAFLRSHIPVEEHPIRTHMEVNGYSCTMGCFAPRTVK